MKQNIKKEVAFYMNLGTVVYDGKIYNLDYMESEEIENLLKKIEENKAEEFSKAKKITKRLRK